VGTTDKLFLHIEERMTSMQKYVKMIIINLILAIFLIGIPTSIFAVDKEAKIGDGLKFTGIVEGPAPEVEDFVPGDSQNYTMQIENTSSVPIGLYFSKATEEISNMNLDKIIFSLYIDEMLYKKGNHIELKEELFYVLDVGKKVTLTTNVALDKEAGNYYQDKEFNIEWEIGVMEYIKEEEPPKQVDPPVIIEESPPRVPGTIIIGEDEEEEPEKPLTITGKISKYLKDKLGSASGSVDSLILLILAIVAILLIIEFARGLRWLIIILLNLRNTKIYVRVYNDEGEKFKTLEEYDTEKCYKEDKFQIIKGKEEEEKYKLVTKIKTRDEDKIVLDLDKLADKYETDDLKIIFNKHISKKINKSKITVHVKEQSFNYNAVYDKKPIDLDVKF
jgi:hypothetical protein